MKVSLKQAYQILGLHGHPAAADVRAAWRRCAFQYHPDRFRTEEEKDHYARKFLLAREAYELLRREGFPELKNEPAPEPDFVLRTAGRDFSQGTREDIPLSDKLGLHLPWTWESVFLWGAVMPAGLLGLLWMLRRILRQSLPAILVFLSLPQALPARQAPERPPQAAGQFYPADPKALTTLVDGLFKEAGSSKIEGKVIAIITPHAGLEFSGRAAARALGLVKPGQWDSIILMGTGHRVPIQGAAIYPGDYATPIGKAVYDRELSLALQKASPLIMESAEAHSQEHSIEDNLPFLLRRLGPFKAVAMLMNTEALAPAVEIGQALAKVIRGKRVLLIVSSDLSHYPSGKIDDQVDSSTLLSLRAVDPALFWMTNRILMNRRLPNLSCTWCGEGAVIAATAAARMLGANRFQVLERFHSGDKMIPPNDSQVVGYAAAAFVKDKTGTPPPSPYALRDLDRKTLLREARETILAKLSGRDALPAPLSDVHAFNLPAAVFVTLQTRLQGHGKQLRGCIGTTQPREALSDAVHRYAVAAAFEDPRFPPLTEQELTQVHIEISILSPLRPISGPGEVHPGMGVTVEKNGRSGLFLPQVWDAIPDKKLFLEELCSQKAGLARDCYNDPSTRLSVFTVESFED